MNAVNSSENIDSRPRRFLETAAMTIAYAQLGMFSSANAEAPQPKPPKRRKL